MRDFRFSVPCQVRIADINYGGHVGNSAVLEFFQEARLAYLARLGAWTELDIGGCGLILPEARIRYRAEMFHGDQLEIGVQITELGKASLTMAYRIERQDQPTAEGTTTLAAFDYARRRPCRLPAAFRTAVKTVEGL